VPAPLALLLRHDEISTSKGYTQWFSQANFLVNAEEGAFRQRGEIRNMQSTTILTMGTALNRAHDHDAIVEVLVGGQWLTGVVAGVDGYGVVLVDAQNDHSVVRMEAISAVRVPGRLAEHQIEARDLYDASVC
jgi:sRNA-binding regulator protein Hfq